MGREAVRQGPVRLGPTRYLLEDAMLALQAAIADARASHNVLQNPPAYNPQSNGSAEVQD